MQATCMEGNLRDSKRADFSLHEKCLSIDSNRSKIYRSSI